jgi:glyoxylate/hydroxypyruvate reductase A
MDQRGKLMDKAIHIVVDEPDMHHYQVLLAEQVPEVKVTICEEPASPPSGIADADVLLTWRPHPHVIKALPNLKWIHSTGAGVEAILRNSSLPSDVTITRTATMCGPLMAQYVITFILAWLFRLPLLQENQQQRRWQQFNAPLASNFTCTVLGMGDIGQEIAQKCQSIGLKVTGISRSGNSVPGFEVLPVSQLEQVLPRTNILVVVLPLTAETEGLLDYQRLSLMPSNSLIVNVARGPIIVEADLIRALQNGTLAGAVLDVFDQEPLPVDSAFWEMKNVMITPHIAGPYDPAATTKVFLENLQRYRIGEPMHYVVDRSREY